MGWTAVTGHLDAPGLALFAVLFLWQIPHFLAIATYRGADYARAGFKVLPLAVSVRATRVTIVVFSIVLVAATIVLEPLHVAGPRYALVRHAAGRRVHRLGGGRLPARGREPLGAVAVLLLDRLPDAAVRRAGDRPDRRMTAAAASAAPVDTSPPRLRADGLSRRFGTRGALDGVSFEVAPGELFGLLGPNGAGKTTAFRLLAGLLPPHAGTLALDGRAGLDRRHRLPRAPGRGVPGGEPGPQADRPREPAPRRRAVRRAARAAPPAASTRRWR